MNMSVAAPVVVDGLNIQIHPPEDMGGFDKAPNAAIAARAERLVNVLHDRHVPLTPGLAIALAQLEQSESPATSPIWGAAFECAADAVGMAGRFGRNRFWARAASDFTQVIAEPLLRRAAQDIGQVRLIGMGEFPAQPKRSAATRCAEFTSYCDEVEQRLAQLMADPTLMGRPFWTEAAVQLYAIAARKPRARIATKQATITPFPFDLDPTLCASVFQIEPVFENKAALNRQMPKPNIRSHRERMGIRPKEGGVNGILHSHRLEDISDALASEFAYPPDLMMLRLLDEGFLIKNRPPLRKPVRDLLMLTTAESNAQERPALLIKAAWADAALRLRIILNQLDLRSSDLGWCDFHSHGPRASALNANLSRAESLIRPFDLHGSQRQQQMLTSTLLPSLFSNLPLNFAPPKPTAEPARLAQSSLAILAAIADAQRHRPIKNWAETQGQTPAPAGLKRPATLADYTRVVSLSVQPLIAPDGARTVFDWAAFRVDTAQNLGLSRVARSGVSALFFPPKIEPGALFYGYRGTNDAPDGIAIPSADDPDAIAKTIGGLSAWIILRVLEVAHAR